jgi:hypothetical protein
VTGGPSRVLEIGDRSLFARTWPDRVRCLWTGHAAQDVEGVPVEPFAVRRAGAVLRALREGAFDLVACHPPTDAPWSPAVVWRMARRYRRRVAPLLVRALGPYLIGRASAVPLVVLDLADTQVVARQNLALLDRARLYFKRELPADRWKALGQAGAACRPGRPDRGRDALRARLAKLRPLSLGISAERLAAIARCGRPEKTVDIFFAGQAEASSTVRADGLAQLRALARRGYRVDVATERLPADEFHARCARARLAWSPEGYGWDCFRHYEVAACGAVPLMNYPTTYRYAPFEEGVHCLYYGPEGDALQRVAVDALRDPARLATMAAAAGEHVRRRHTHEQLCEYVLRAAGVG